MRYLKVISRCYIAVILIAGAFAPAIAVAAPTFHLSVVTDKTDHLAWKAASRFTELAAKNGLKVKIKLANRAAENKSSQTSAAPPDLIVMPLHSMATQVPALDVLELPFFFSEIQSVHQAFDGKLGSLLREQTRQQGWELLTLWDEGMHVMSGNRRYDHAINLTGMEFILLRPDLIAEKQFKAFDAWTRSARPQTREQLLRECMIGSRSASLQKIWYEKLDRVHLSLSLTKHRYEGWVVVAPLASWNSYGKKDQAALRKTFSAMRLWQHAQAQQRENKAQQKLQVSGMLLYKLTTTQRAEFIKRLPTWDALLSNKLSQTLKQKLITTATTATFSLSAKKALLKTQPTTP